MLPLLWVLTNPIGPAVLRFRDLTHDFWSRSLFYLGSGGWAPILVDPSSRFYSDFIPNASFGNRQYALPLDLRKYTAEQSATDCNYCNLEGDCTGINHTLLAPIFISRFAGWSETNRLSPREGLCLQEDTKIVGQCVKLKSGFVVRPAIAQKSCLVERRLTSFYALPFGVTLIKENVLSSLALLSL